MEWWASIGSACVAGVVSGLVPIALAEATALAAAAIPSMHLRAAVIVAFTVGHVAGKGVWYLVGTLESRVTRPSLRRWIDRAREVATAHPTAGLGVTAASATVSMPPFHLLVIAAGIVRTPAAPFFSVALVGRLLRFGAIAASPSAARWLWSG
jgi:membrane protein YqaA with SNARE-associated domain